MWLPRCDAGSIGGTNKRFWNQPVGISATYSGIDPKLGTSIVDLEWAVWQCPLWFSATRQDSAYVLGRRSDVPMRRVCSVGTCLFRHGMVVFRCAPAGWRITSSTSALKSSRTRPSRQTRQARCPTQHWSSLTTLCWSSPCLARTTRAHRWPSQQRVRTLSPLTSTTWAAFSRLTSPWGRTLDNLVRCPSVLQCTCKVVVKGSPLRLWSCYWVHQQPA